MKYETGKKTWVALKSHNKPHTHYDDCMAYFLVNNNYGESGLFTICKLKTNISGFAGGIFSCARKHMTKLELTGTIL